VRTYDPLNVSELGRNAARALMAYPADELPPKNPFAGVGVYTLHYVGTFPAYINIREDVPIYVGKADPQGRRQGSVSATSVDTALYRRFSDHARSIESVDNLDLNDFRCRWLKLDPVWIGLTEQVLIAQYRPLWNVVVDGFGNHDPGGGRRNQRRSQWDTLHPGRRWASNLRDREETATEVMNAVIAHRSKDSPT
jgi:hypothetical protein